LGSITKKGKGKSAGRGGEEKGRERRLGKGNNAILAT
jgi:hypothetical protein